MLKKQQLKLNTIRIETERTIEREKKKKNTINNSSIDETSYVEISNKKEEKHTYNKNNTNHNQRTNTHKHKHQKNNYHFFLF